MMEILVPSEYLISIIGVLLMFICSYVGAQIHALRNSVENLNKNFAVYIQKTENHSKRIHDHEARLRVVEQK